jgi:hypothetical protein
MVRFQRAIRLGIAVGLADCQNPPIVILMVPHEGFDAHTGVGYFGNTDGFDRGSGPRPDV